MTLLLLLVAMPVSVYLVLSTPWAQEKIRTVARDQLCGLLGTDVEISRVDYEPFNTIAVSGVRIADDNGKTALSVAALRARFELWHFLRTRRLVFDYAIIDVPEVWLSKETPLSPLNIRDIIARLSPADSGKPPTEFDLKVGTLVVRNGLFSYDILDRERTPGKFNPSHIALSGISLHVYLRHATRQHADLLLESLSFREACGFELKSMSANIEYTSDSLKVDKLKINLPQSHIAFAPICVPVGNGNDLKKTLSQHDLKLSLAEPAVLNTEDFAPFWDKLAGTNRRFVLDFAAQGNLKKAALDRFSLSDSHGLELWLKAEAENLDSIDGIRYAVDELRVAASASETASIARIFSPEAAMYADRAGDIRLKAVLSGRPESTQMNMDIETAEGSIALTGNAGYQPKLKTFNFNGNLTLKNINAGTLLGEARLGHISIPAEVNFSRQAASLPEVTVTIADGSAEWNGHVFSGLFARIGFDSQFASVQLASPTPGASFSLDADARHAGELKSMELKLDINDLRPELLGFQILSDGLAVRATLNVEAEGSSADDVTGLASLENLVLTTPNDNLKIDLFEIEASGTPAHRDIAVRSQFLNGDLEGRFHPSSLVSQIREMATHIVPALVEPMGADTKCEDRPNIFDVELSLSNAEQLCRFFHLPVTAVYPLEIFVNMNSAEGKASFLADAPYLQQGDKIIDGTNAGAIFDAEKGTANVYASTHMPTKKGPMAVSIDIDGATDVFNTAVHWEIERAIPLNGVIDFATTLGRNSSEGFWAYTDFHPGQINFGDDTWNILPSRIDWRARRLSVDHFSLEAGKQKVLIDGVASSSAEDKLIVDLNNIDLISIFETLEIENALLTGCATGRFTASQVFSRFPMFATPNLHVDDIGYNYCVLGNADIKAAWDADCQGIRLDADIVNPEGQHSVIGGYLYPAAESLDLDFLANNVKVGFMQPFMKAFASDISGFASGHARLFGTFHDIDMEGDVYARDLSLKLDFTNTRYHTSDSIHIRPGIIKLENIILRDDFDNTARLDGVLTHTFFHLPEFDFRVSDAHNFLCYDVTPKINPDWYGTVFGNGGASVKGKPGLIEIGVNMATTKGSTFTFVLSDQLEAEQYSFITFRDVTDYSLQENILTMDDTPQVVKDYQQRMKNATLDAPSNYVMDIRVDITPDAQVNLVMDPVGGDRIKAYGAGDLRMTYNAFENDLRMYGTYTLDRGNYNFTLQDIIIKDFTIEPGSSIAFRGDPYSAQLDIEAIYQVNANLSDLDESFTQDKALNRTNVPVQALMKVTGDMRQPDIAFDLRFPTLTSDTYRKVKSIISTDDMMNRQIIYLLALNRFYTPDYMASTTKGNELFSVASSTISSQLSSMLGKLSENWSIAPNLRSDRGDFSDVEVDVALSSRLLNNRLLFNGNFGYRDKKLNSNQFIGDFDIEYLLNPKGLWRLKAYNRYNDQNYYVRTATTTQGLGIMLRRDFDDIFGRKPKTCEGETPHVDNSHEAEPDSATVVLPHPAPTASATE